MRNTKDNEPLYKLAKKFADIEIEACLFAASCMPAARSGLINTEDPYDFDDDPVENDATIHPMMKTMRAAKIAGMY